MTSYDTKNFKHLQHFKNPTFCVECKNPILKKIDGFQINITEDYYCRKCYRQKLETYKGE